MVRTSTQHQHQHLHQHLHQDISNPYRMQADMQLRVVAVSNLRAMCQRVSGTCHTYHVTKITSNRCYVECSNPNEYGVPNPMVAVFPCIPSGFGEPYVVLHIVNVTNDRDGEGWQCFMPLLDCPELFRSTMDSAEWFTRDEIKQQLAAVEIGG